jgi:ABC-type transport system involved in cytochrome c biogenesis permease subunit
MTAIGFVLGACWAHREWGHFVEWNLKEIGAMTVFGLATVFYLIVTRQRLGTMRLGQVALTMSFVTLVSWFGPNMFR